DGPRAGPEGAVDAYGVGTKLVTGSGHPTAELVYKLVAREGADGRFDPVQKESESKRSIGGRKLAGRVLEDGHAVEEVTVTGGDPGDAERHLEDLGARPLQVELIRDGAVVEEHRGPAALQRATERHLASRAELPYPAWRLSEGEPALTTRHVSLGS
ncbi:MAG: nicotinate phosphoribosyltransferase, partial [Actinomycetes bacterium]|nr:nicotinate phosphoribosyltransferase [Actinomycetes bacterium]MDX5380702.1 nicotinate phosphoribosyltransferase [Actinomycetes bacterium]MDX5399693.1 nicotinate phosphoribosyltransferase [Actinomycetes bacterium]MDX5450438.1 nicotinate phosphoribosyltransferase [Actinomycetes bacterium]